MLRLYKILFFIFLFYACSKASSKYAPIVNFNSKYIHKIPKYKKKIILLTGQIYYFPHCQGQVVFFYKTPYRVEMYILNSSFDNFALDGVLTNDIRYAGICMTCEKRAVPGMRLKENCELYNAPYWELVGISTTENSVDTLFLEKKQNFKFKSSVLLLPK